MDDGKRAASVLEVDLSPLRANKGGSLKGGRAEKLRVGGFMRGSWDIFSRSFAVFSDFFVHIDLLSILEWFWEGFGTPTWTLIGAEIEIFGVFGDMLFKTLILVECCLIFDKVDGEQQII